MKSLRLAVAAALVLSAGAAHAASRGGPPLVDLTGCCGSIHKAEHEKNALAAQNLPASDRGRVQYAPCSMKAAPTTPAKKRW